MQKGIVRAALERILEQERSPTFTTISLLITTLVWPLVVALVIHKPGAWAELAQAASLFLLLLLGIAANCIAGAVAQRRREYCGGWIAATGVAFWLVTVIVLAISKKAWFVRP